MNIGDYVQMNVGKPLKGFIVEPPQRAIREYWNKNSVWILITHTPDGKFVGKAYPFQKHQIEVLSENR